MTSKSSSEAYCGTNKFCSFRKLEKLVDIKLVTFGNFGEPTQSNGPANFLKLNCLSFKAGIQFSPKLNIELYTPLC